MRTDSTRVAAEALGAVRERIASTWGEDHIPEKPIFYKSKAGAQDAHEAIRPTYLDHDPESIKSFLGKDEYALYKLIWNRFVASQMRPAVYDETVADITPVPTCCGQGVHPQVQGLWRFRGDSGRAAREPAGGGARASRGRHVARDGGRAASAHGGGRPPRAQELDTDQHFTSRRRAFRGHAGQELEENGIGRPSTYASIIATIEAREYMEKREASSTPPSRLVVPISS